MVGQDWENISPYHPTGCGAAALSNRVSWFYDLRGPSMTIDTACSSSLVALHLACQSLRTGESKLAIVGGTNFMCSPEFNVMMSTMHFVGPDSKCQTFDEKGNGYARGEGASFVVVKPLQQALADGNVIRCVIRNSGSNQDGKTPGLTMPSAESQEALIRQCYADAGLDLADTGYFECHGTGTAAGDPIETSVLGATFGKVRRREQPLYIGSVKPNIGHLEGASGLAGVTKALYMLEKGLIPRQIWFDKLNPRIHTDEWNLRIPTETIDWPYEGPRRISVNSFGFGGANAHCIMEDAYSYLNSRRISGNHCTKFLTSDDFNSSDDEAVSLQNRHSEVLKTSSISTSSLDAEVVRLVATAPKLLVWTSNEEAGLTRYRGKLSEYLLDKLSDDTASDGVHMFEDLCFTLASRRSIHAWKTFVLAESIEDLAEALEEDAAKPVRSNTAPKLGFVFTGQGSQHFAMGRELFGFTVYRKSLEAATEYLSSIGVEWSVVDELWRDSATSRLDSPIFSQTICTALQVALVDLLAHWNIHPAAVVGHSSGEIAAAYAKGALSQQAAWLAAYHRGVLSEHVSTLNTDPAGGMLATALTEAKAAEVLAKLPQGKARVACVNSPDSVTFSGDISALESLQAILRGQGKFARMLKVKAAYHSHHMEAVAEQYLQSMRDLETLPDQDKTVEMFSSVYSRRIESNAELGAGYWVANMIRPVQFSAAVQAMSQYIPDTHQPSPRAAPFCDILVEIGPHGTLQSPLKQIVKSINAKVNCLSLLTRGKDCRHTSLELVGRLYQEGYVANVDNVNNPSLDTKSRQTLVDLPSYAWNHSTTHWWESAVSRDYRFRKHPRKNLLGYPTPEGNSDERRWRNFLRLSESPWIEDHSVQGTLLYPAAGMMVMAIEAASQMVDESKEVSGYELRDVTIGSALVVPRDAAGVETSIHVRPRRTGTRDATHNWHEFTIYSRIGHDGWSQNATGLLRIEYRKSDCDALFADEDALTRTRYQKEHERILQQSTHLQSGKSFYDHQNAIGLQLGPSFCNFSELHRSGHQVAASMKIPDTAATMPHNFEYKHVVHPCTLDTIVQTILLAILGPREELPVAAIPTFISRCYVSADIPTAAGTVLQSYGVNDYLGFNEAESSVVASDPSWQKPLVVLERTRSKQLPPLTDNTKSGSDNDLRKMTGEIRWNYDYPLLSNEDLTAILASSSTKDTLPVDRHDKELDIVARDIAEQTLRELSDLDPARLTAHHAAYYNYLQSLTAHANMESSSTTPKNSLATAVADSALGTLLERLRQNLTAIVRDDVDAVQVLNHDMLLEETMSDNDRNRRSYDAIANHYALISHGRPDAKILQVNGTNSKLAECLLTRIKADEEPTPRLGSYTFATRDESVLESVNEKLSADAPYMSFSKLDMNNEPTSQSFELGSFDVIVAEDICRGAHNLGTVISNIKALLKPDGVLLLRETTNNSVHGTIMHGIFPNWWLQDSKDQLVQPCLSAQAWDDVLSSAGFDITSKSVTSLDLDEKARSIVISAKASRPADTVDGDEVMLVEPDTPSTPIQNLATNMEQYLTSQGMKVVRTTLRSTYGISLSQKRLVMLTDIETSSLFDCQDLEFQCVQKILLEAQSSTWITRGATVDCDGPQTSLINGLARSVRSENVDTAISVIDLDSKVDLNDKRNIEAIARVDRLTAAAKGQSNIDWEYSVREGCLLIPRLYVQKGMNDLLASLGQEPEPVQVQLKDCPPVTLEIGAQGMLDSLRFKVDSTYNEPLADADVEISVKASGLNFMDIMVAMGQIQETDTGLEVAGIVSRVGPAVTRFKPGDRVLSMLTHGFGTYVRSDQCLVKHIPESLDYDVAASIPMVYSTAYCALIDSGRLCKGEKVLIHAAAGGVGQAAIMIAKYIGAEVFATVSSKAKKQLLMDRYNIPEAHIFSSRDLNFVAGIHRLTNSNGVDVVVNSLSGEGLRQTWHCMAWFGRFVELGKRDLTINAGLDMAPFLRQVTYSSVNIIGMMRQAPARAGALLESAFDLIRQEHCEPVYPIKSMDYSEVESAFRLLQTGGHMGKLVLCPNPESKIAMIPQPETPANFSPHHTYVLSGGLGGLGRTIAQWMVDRGARNLLFLSRSGTAKESAARLIEDLRLQGVNADAYKCDICDEQAVKDSAIKCRASMPPVKGIIQAAMVLNDTVFSNMNHQQFRDTVRPKVQGTWNLHKSFDVDDSENDLDFFVMLSSASGIIGNRGQANYAAGNAFQDAFAHYRRGLGLKASAIDVGMVLGAGFVSENDDVAAILKASGFTGIEEQELLTMLQAATNGRTSQKNILPAQLITGMSTGGMALQDGADIPWYLDDMALFRFFRIVDTHGLSAATNDEQKAGLRIILANVQSLNAAVEAVLEVLRLRLAKWMSISPEDIDTSKPVSHYGIDSLTAVELRSWAFKECQADISVFDVMAGNPMTGLAEQVVKKSKLVSAEFAALLAQ